ncbi:class A beta-lactamase [Burkholderia sp. Bp9002]|nr:class A beta-lactamase [Burkholderia sp. Bp9002]
MYILTRRSFCLAAFGLALGVTLPARGQVAVSARASEKDKMTSEALDSIRSLEMSRGGRLGVAVLDTGSGRRLQYRADESFAMCSTHKFLSAVAVLSLVDQGKLALDKPVKYGNADLLDYAPVAREHVERGFMTVDELCAAATVWSDNTAANLLLELLGGPAGWTRFARSIGDDASRLDRTEPALNSAIPGDPRDTTTPDAMLANLKMTLLGTVLSESSREKLQSWMLSGTITDTLLRAGVPLEWRVGDKSGAGKNGTRNDIGIIFPPDASPILAAIYYTESTGSLASREEVIAEVGGIIAETFGA